MAASAPTKPELMVNPGPTIRFDGKTVYINSIIAQLEHIDNIAHSELRKVKLDGVRPCLQKDGAKTIKHMIFFLENIMDKLVVIEAELKP